MKKSSITSLLFLALLPFLPTSLKAQSYTGIVAFGDSLSDIGNTVTTGDAKYGAAFTSQETGYNANFYDNGRFSDGPLWVENLDSELGLPALGANNGITNISGTDFAWAGSTSGTGLTLGLIPNLQTQIGFYSNQLASNNAALPSPATTLYTVWSGGEDVINLVNSNSSITPAQFAFNLAMNISNSITSLYDDGGRSFLIPNLPPLGYKPNYLTNTADMQAANNYVDAYDPLLQSTLASLSTNLPGIKLMTLNVYSIFENILTNPTSYGLTNVTGSAYTASTNGPEYGSVVTNPNAYLFWDQTHATATVNTTLGTAAYTTVVPEPTTSALLLITFLLIVMLHFRIKSTYR